MSKHATNETFQEQQRKLVRSTFKKGFISAIHMGSNTVDVSYAESPQTIVRNIPIANSVSISTVIVGQRCRVDLFDETNPQDSVLAYTY